MPSQPKKQWDRFYFYLFNLFLQKSPALCVSGILRLMVSARRVGKR